MKGDRGQSGQEVEEQGRRKEKNIHLAGGDGDEKS